MLKLPLVLSTALFALSGSDGRAASPSSPSVETRAAAERGPRAAQGHERADLCAMLSCTAAQRAAIDGVLTKMREQLKALHGTRGEQGNALADAMRDGSLDRAEVLGAMAKNDELRAKREGIVADAIVGVYGALDKTQRARLTKLVDERGAKAVLGGGHHGKHHGKAGKPEHGKGKAKGKGKKGERKPGKSARLSRVKAPVAKVGFTSGS